jgi:hypothetical protein
MHDNSNDTFDRPANDAETAMRNDLIQLSGKSNVLGDSKHLEPELTVVVTVEPLSVFVSPDLLAEIVSPTFVDSEEPYTQRTQHTKSFQDSNKQQKFKNKTFTLFDGRLRINQCFRRRCLHVVAVHHCRRLFARRLSRHGRKFG